MRVARGALDAKAVPTRTVSRWKAGGTVRTEPSFAYTRGNPITYLSVQSPTLDGFDGGDVAVTAFHYHDTRSGRVSNGCLRVDEAAAHALAALPLGTPVIIRE